jgi:pimeloyl-ACP methyl ester carboxylesterase
MLLPHLEKLAQRRLASKGWKSGWYATPAGRVHTYEAEGFGKLPTTVILHGIASNGIAFARTMSRVRRHVRRVVTLELPGHGQSEDPRLQLTPEILFESVACALDTIEKEPFVLAGNSLGGAVALRYAIDRPKNVHALALFSPAGARVDDEKSLQEIISAFDAKGARHALKLLRRIYHKQPWFLPIIALDMPAVLARKAVRDLAATMKPHHGIAPHELAALDMPVVFVWGRSERLFPRGYFEYFRQHLPKHARILEPDAVGHCSHFDDPSGTADWILDVAREAP